MNVIDKYMTEILGNGENTSHQHFLRSPHFVKEKKKVMSSRSLSLAVVEMGSERVPRGRGHCLKIIFISSLKIAGCSSLILCHKLESLNRFNGSNCLHV